MDLRAASLELEALVGALEREGNERALRLLELVDAIHRPALGLIADGRVGHPLVRALLAMYELADVDDALLAEEALDTLRARLGPAEAVDLLGVEDGVVRVRLRAAPPESPEARAALERRVEASLREGYPGFVAMETTVTAHGIALPVASPDTGPPAAPLELVHVRPLRGPVLVDIAALDDVPPGTPVAVRADGHGLLLVNLDGSIHAVHDACPEDGQSLAAGRLTGSVLVCPWHNCSWDIRSGRRADSSGGLGLRVVPVTVEQGVVRAAVDVG